ncbi:unnamed protein product, partial [Thlaspi arvense]
MASGSEPTKNIVLVGRAGNGKSATGNSLVRRKIFLSGAQATGVTMTCQTFRAVIPNGPIINVIDTPGLFDLITKPDIISKEIVRCLALAEEGLHAVVLVLSVRTRITKEEEDSLCTLQVIFGARILDYLIVVFTGGDELDSNNQTLETYLQECPEFLKNIFRLCGHRKVLFDNRTDDDEKRDRQIQQLLNYVEDIGRRNRGILMQRIFDGNYQRCLLEAQARDWDELRHTLRVMGANFRATIYNSMHQSAETATFNYHPALVQVSEVELEVVVDNPLMRDRDFHQQIRDEPSSRDQSDSLSLLGLEDPYTEIYGEPIFDNYNDAPICDVVIDKSCAMKRVYCNDPIFDICNDEDQSYDIYHVDDVDLND